MGLSVCLHQAWTPLLPSFRCIRLSVVGSELLVAERELHPGCLIEQCPFCANFQVNAGNVGTLMLSGETSGQKFLCLVFRMASGRDLTVHLSYL